MDRKQLRTVLDAARPHLHDALHGRDVGPVVVIPLAALMERDSLTRERIRILLDLREHGAAKSLQELADRLNRSKARVSQDIKALKELQLVHNRRHGARMTIEAETRPVLLA